MRTLIDFVLKTSLVHHHQSENEYFMATNITLLNTIIVIVKIITKIIITKSSSSSYAAKKISGITRPLLFLYIVMEISPPLRKKGNTTLETSVKLYNAIQYIVSCKKSNAAKFALHTVLCIILCKKGNFAFALLYQTTIYCT